MIKLKPRYTTGVGLILLGVIIAFAFQNCGSPFAIETYQSSVKTDTEVDSAFDYPYSAKPDFYSHLSLYKAADEKLTALTNMTFIGAATFVADPLVPVAYKVSIRTASGSAMCPTQSGLLSGGFSNIQFDCVSTLGSSEAVVEMELTAEGKTVTVRETYHN